MTAFSLSCIVASSPRARCLPASDMLSPCVPRAKWAGFTHDRWPFPQRWRTTMSSYFGVPNVSSAMYRAAVMFFPRKLIAAGTSLCEPGTNMHSVLFAFLTDSTKSRMLTCCFPALISLANIPRLPDAHSLFGLRLFFGFMRSGSPWANHADVIFDMSEVLLAMLRTQYGSRKRAAFRHARASMAVIRSSPSQADKATRGAIRHR